MAEIQKPNIKTITGATYGASMIEKVIDYSADDVGMFIDKLPEEHRERAMTAIEAQIALRREALMTQESEQVQQ